jgi:hypothetical protein
VQSDFAEADFMVTICQEGGVAAIVAVGAEKIADAEVCNRDSSWLAASLEELKASKEAQLAVGLCIQHWWCGKATSSGTQACSWQGNSSGGN